MKAGKTAEDTSSTPVIGQSPYIMPRSGGSHNAGNRREYSASFPELPLLLFGRKQAF